MSNPIVKLFVSQQQAPKPATLQKQVAFVSQGGTLTSKFAYSFLTQLSDLTPLLNGSKVVSAATWSSGVLTVTAALAHGFTIGDTLEVTLAGFTSSGAAINGTYLATVTTATAFTVPLATTPGTISAYGSYTLEDVAELLAMAITFFAQGSTQGVYVLELGPGNPNDGVAALTTYLTANPNSNYTAGAPGYFYAYLVPRTWDANPNFLSLLASYESNSALTYFYITSTLATYSVYTSLMKCAKVFIEAPAFALVPAAISLTALSPAAGGPFGYQITGTTASAHGVSVGQWFQIAGATPSGYDGWNQAQVGTTGSTLVWYEFTNPGTETALGNLLPNYYASSAIPVLEFSAASDFWVNANRAPSTTNKITPNRFAFVYGVTPFPQQGLSALVSTLENANINYVDTGAEGGLSTAMIVPGTTMDGQDFASWWYGIDWVQLNANLNVANDVINGSNNPINPLYYNQQGIDREQAVVAGTINSAITFGMVFGSTIQTALDGPVLAAALNAGTYAGLAIINAVPFATYATENPTHYGQRLYQGLSVTFVPQNGFAQITINVTVSNFVNLV